MSDEFDDLMDEAIENIRNDRKVAREFLNELANQIAQNAENNRALSPVAAKHIETMQRSNEQLVKVLTLKQKERTKEIGLTDEDKASLFDMIQGDACWHVEKIITRLLTLTIQMAHQNYSITQSETLSNMMPILAMFFRQELYTKPHLP